MKSASGFRPHTGSGQIMALLVPLFAIGFLAFGGWQSWALHQSASTTREADDRFTELISRVEPLNEIRALAADAALVTPDLRWGEKYNEARDRLERVFDEAMSLSPDTGISKAVALAQATVTKMVAAEESALDWARRGDRRAARAMMAAEEIQRQRKALTTQVEQVLAQRQFVREAVGQRQLQQAMLTLAGGGVSVLLLLAMMVSQVRSRAQGGARDWDRVSEGEDPDSGEDVLARHVAEDTRALGQDVAVVADAGLVADTSDATMEPAFSSGEDAVPPPEHTVTNTTEMQPEPESAAEPQDGKQEDLPENDGVESSIDEESGASVGDEETPPAGDLDEVVGRVDDALLEAQDQVLSDAEAVPAPEEDIKMGEPMAEGTETAEPDAPADVTVDLESPADADADLDAAVARADAEAHSLSEPDVTRWDDTTAAEIDAMLAEAETALEEVTNSG